ncbi:uncharacterized protein LOC124943567 [Impatiens glandulifera]|uniref:uncharacterized protein LOC124943567 n=1 Tax=Impatiens glandulifera TaxID=253017 RepID=UPI001FB08B5E|nr:uncharacterized protein LOC124943567 [Impatiens glandulifera]
MDKTLPTSNVNLSPFEQWRSAHFCILYYKPPNPCPAKYNLTEAGVINVDPTDAAEYCQQNGCGDYTKSVVLNCIHHVKRNYIFANKATVKQINDTINQVCSSYVANPPNISGSVT